jgi:NAD-dependent deacetylase
MHGRIMQALCAECGHQWGWTHDMALDDICHSCSTVGTVRPDVVWFGETPYQMETIWARMTDCDLFAAIGTSGAVYPAAGFVTDARHRGARTLEINLEPSENAATFDQRLLGLASETVPMWVEGLLGGTGD